MSLNRALTRSPEEVALSLNSDSGSRSGSPPGGTLSNQAAAEFAGHVAGLVGAGLALPEGLRALGEELGTGLSRRLLFEIADDLEAGRSLEEAIQVRGDRFPAHLAGIVRAAARSGRMAEVMAEAVRAERVGIDLRRRLWLSLAYPITLFIAFLALFVFLSTVVLSDFEMFLYDFGIDLPPVTIALIYLSRFLNESGVILLLILVAMLPILWYLTRGGGQSWRRRVSGSLPLIGPLGRFSAMAEFSHLLAILLECKLPMPEALPLAADGVRDPDLARTSRAIADEIAAGKTLAEAAPSARVFPPGFTRLLTWAEENQSLPEALRLAGEIFEGRARTQAAIIGIFAFVLVVVLVLLGLQLIASGMFLPLIRLISELSG